MSRIKVLPAITTLNPIENANTWREKIKEIEELDLKEISLFVTDLNPGQRQECYKLIEETSLENIPHVHLRNDMEKRELDYLASRFNTEVFNTHPTEDRPLIYDWDGYWDKIYIENTKFTPSKGDLKKFAGICLDFVHWENAILKGYPNYNSLSDLVRKYPIGCGHLSPLKSNIEDNPESDTDYDAHYMENLSEFDYLKKYDDYLPSIISIEAKNSLTEQLQIKRYVEDNIL